MPGRGDNSSQEEKMGREPAVEETCMADTLGQSADQSGQGSTIRSGSAALAIIILAFAPQIFELLWSVAGLIFGSSGRNPVQVVVNHASALVLAIPALIELIASFPHWVASFFGAAVAPVVKGAAGASSDVLLALIYAWPLIGVAVFTSFVRLRAPQDYFGGVVLVALGLFALWASSDLQGMHGFSFGAGTVPRMFAVLLVALGAAIAVVGLFTDGPELATYAWRGPLFVSLSILSFAVTIRPLGLVVSAFVSFMVAALGTAETKWKETIIVGICLTIGCSLLFPYALGLPLQLFPRFLVQ
jgi:Tripartite tricarboxylate transporter TctB family